MTKVQHSLFFYVFLDSQIFILFYLIYILYIFIFYIILNYKSLDVLSSINAISSTNIKAIIIRAIDIAKLK